MPQASITLRSAWRAIRETAAAAKQLVWAILALMAPNNRLKTGGR